MSDTSNPLPTAETVADHERIWLEAPPGGPEGRLWCEDKVWPDDENDGEPTEYVRADLYAAAEARVAALEAEKAGLVEALEQVAAHPASYDDGVQSFAVGWAFRNVKNIARQALSSSSTEVKNDG